MTTIVNNTHEAVEVITTQLNDKSNYPNNYRLLESLDTYLDNCPDKDESDFDKLEQIYNHLAYDLKWEQNEGELFPMEL